MIVTIMHKNEGAGMAAVVEWLPRNGPGFDSLWVQCKNQASHPLQGTANGGAVSK